MVFRFSKKLMEKFGSIVHTTIDSLYRKKTVNWRIDWRNKRLVTNIQIWLKEQIANPSKDMLLLARRFEKYSTHDRKIMSILRWVKRNVKYKKDQDVWNIKEKWQTAEETLSKKTGDCEDGAVLILVLARLNNIPHTQVKLTAGNVVSGGHCWVEYRASFDGVNRLIDWCYYYSPMPTHKRRAASQDTRYLDRWFRVNDVRGYGSFKYENKR
jgi:hypothetical protein